MYSSATLHSRRRRLRLTVTFWVVLGVVTALLLLTVLSPSRTSGHSAAGAHASTTSARLKPPSLKPPSPTQAPNAEAPKTDEAGLQLAIDSAYAYDHQHGYRLGIAVTELDSGQTWHAGDPGTFGTGSVIKALIAAKMLLTGDMTGAAAIEARHMIVYSDDEDGTDLWQRYGGPDIISWLSEHYGTHFGEPNLRPNFWGNTQVTAQSLAAFYQAVHDDPLVWPWLSEAMAHAERIASDGTDQYYGIPRAGGGHTVKQSWGTRSSGDGYSEDATVNSTGFVRVGKHLYAVVILTEGHGNDAAADSRGYVHAQGDLITAVARIVLDGMRDAR